MSAERPAPRATVLVPSVLADYACGRTLVCCKPPWRVYLGPHEDDVLLGRVGRAGDRRLTARVRAAIERPAPGVTLLAQPEEGCPLLDDEEPGCAVHRVAGMSALPATCRNFPRSVVRTPEGLEVAFLLQCPTAAGMVARAPAPFSWVERDLDGWPYDDRRTAARDLWWDARTPLSWDDLAGLRARWWRRLGADGEEPPSAAALNALRTRPDAPEAEAPSTLAPLEPDEVLADAERRFLERLAARGARYAELGNDLTDALVTPTDEASLAHAWALSPHAWLCAAGLALQHAGVHTRQPVSDVFSGAAWQGIEAVQLAARLLPLAIGDPHEMIEDALCTAAHVVRWLAHSQSQRG